MDYFADLSFFRFNHLPNHQEVIDCEFSTYALNFAPRGVLEWAMGDGPVVRLSAPVAYWTWPGVRFRYRGVGPTPWEHLFVSFRGDRVERWARGGLFPMQTPRPYLQVTQPSVIRQEFARLIELLAFGTGHNPRAAHHLEGLLMALHTQPPLAWARHPRRGEIEHLLKRIDDDPAGEFEVAKEARRMDITPAHLRRLFRAIAGRSPTAYVIQARLARAAEKLRTTDTPIKQIAAATGTPDVYYFTKLFKRQFDLPPAKYRQAFRRIGDAPD